MPLQGAVREVREETGAIVPADAMQFRGLVEWRFPNKRVWEMLASVFVAERWAGDIGETPEIEPVWYAFDDVPFDLMWPDARMWVPGVLRGGHVDLLFVYGPDNATITSMTPRPPAASPAATARAAH
jgi:8-oxo-dGTP diphosphatase